MALDFMAIVSNGSYPTPTPTGQQRAIFAVTHGLLGSLTESELPSSGVINIMLKIGRAGINFARGVFRIGK